MAKLLAIVCLALFAVCVLATATEESGPFSHKYEQRKKAEFDKIRAAKKAAAEKKKTFKPKKFMHRSRVITVPKGDPRAYGPVIPADRVLPHLDLVTDRDPIVGAAADIMSPFSVAPADVVVVVVAPPPTPASLLEQEQETSSNVDKCLNAGGKCATGVCQGTQQRGLCSGAAICCIPWKNTPACAAKNGVCANSAGCTGTKVTGLCPGASVCCAAATSSAPTTPVTPTPTPTPTTPTGSALPQCSNGAASSGSYAGTDSRLNVKAATTWRLIPSVAYNSESGNPYRVARDAYSSIDATDPRLVNVPTSSGKPQQKLHKVCAARFAKLAAAAAAAGVGTLKVNSGWRVHPYKNDHAYYCQQMKIAYPTKTCAQAALVKAFKSPHETGLAFDLGSPSPFSPEMAKDAAIRKSAGFKWMVANAHLYGITPYKHESWHWECVIPRESFVTGCEFTQNGNFNTRVEEKTAKGTLTTNISGWSA